jgi:hypothetical protein
LKPLALLLPSLFRPFTSLIFIPVSCDASYIDAS